MFTVDANLVAVAAFPLVSWLPDWSTPGNWIDADPSNDCPPMSLAFVNVAADPDHAVDVNDVPPTFKALTFMLPLLSRITIWSVELAVLAFKDQVLALPPL